MGSNENKKAPEKKSIDPSCLVQDPKKQDRQNNDDQSTNRQKKKEKDN